MSSGTVGYTDTRGNKDYLSIIANQVGKRLKEASDMASEERAFASEQAELGGTSLEEAGIGKGFFFGRALGSRFGGDRIARTKGRMGMGGAGTNPTSTPAQRFRGGFDYNVTNDITNLTNIAPLSGALSSGLRDVSGGLTQVAAAISRQSNTLNDLANTQVDMARAIMFNGYLFQMFMSQQKAKSGRASLAREERSIETRSGGSGGGGFGGRGSSGVGGRGGRGMINITPPSGGGSGGGMGGSAGGSGNFGGDDLFSFASSQVLSRPKMLESTLGGITGIRNVAKTGKVGSTVAQSDVLRAAFAGSQGFDPAKVSRNVNALLGTGSGLGMKLTSLFGGALGFDAAKVGAASMDEAILTGKMLDSMMVNGKNSPMALEAIADMYNYKIRGADDKFVNELLDIQTRSQRYKKFANLHGNNKLRKTVEGSQYLENLAMDRKVFRAMRQNGKRMFNNETIEAFLKMGLSPGEYNVLAFNALESVSGMSGKQMNMFGIDAADTMENFGIKGGIAEDLQKFFPGGAVKMVNAEQALILTRYARELDAIKKGAVATKAESKAAMSNVELLFGQKKVQKAIAEGGGALATNTGVMKSLARVGGKRFLDALPGIGLAMGTYFAIDRARKGDYFGAGLEITSGLLGLLPGVGTGFGLAIDGYLLGRDMGVMPMYDGATVSGFGTNSILSVNGTPFASFNEPGNLENLKIEKTEQDPYKRRDKMLALGGDNLGSMGAIGAVLSIFGFGVSQLKNVFEGANKLRQKNIQKLNPDLYDTRNLNSLSQNSADPFQLSNDTALASSMNITSQITNIYNNNGGGGDSTRDEILGQSFDGLNLSEYTIKMGAARKS